MQKTYIILCYLILMSAGPLPLMAQQLTVGTYTFKDGGEYQGELVKGKPN